MSRSVALLLGAVVALFAFSGCTGFGNTGGNGSTSGGSGSGGNGDAYASGSGDAGSSSDAGTTGGDQDTGYNGSKDAGNGSDTSGGSKDSGYGGSRDWIGIEQKLGWIENDLLSEDTPAAREDFRYISLVNKHNNPNVSNKQLKKLRWAMSMALNSLSTGQTVVNPEPIDKYNTVYRVDLEDYGWDAQTWEQVVAIYPYAIKYDPDSNVFPVDEEIQNRIREETGTQIPVVQADWFVDEVTKAPLYYDILELPANLGQLEEQLGVNIDENIQDEEVDRSGFAQSGPSEENRVIERHELPGGVGALWVSYDFGTSSGAQNIFSNPVNFDEDGGEFIFNLPNGLQGYYISAANGARLDKAPQAIVTDSSRPDNAVQTAISCMGCHNAKGIIPKDDEIRQHAKSTLSANEREQVLALYPRQTRLDQLYKDDGTRFLDAKEQTGLKRSSSTTVLNVVLNHEDEMPIKRVAMNLGIQQKKLESELSASFADLPDPIKTLRNTDGTIARETYEDVENQLICAIGLGNPINNQGRVLNCQDVLSE